MMRKGLDAGWKESKIQLQRENFKWKEWVRMSTHAAKPVTHRKKHASAQIPTFWRTHTENRFSHDHDTTESVWHDDKCPGCCQSISQPTRRAGTRRSDAWCTRWGKDRERHWGCQCLCLKAGVAEMKLEWGNRMSGDMQAAETELHSLMKPPCSCKRPYFQIRWGFQPSSGWRPPPQPGLRGTRDWTSTSGPQTPHAGPRLHIPSVPFQPGPAPKKHKTIWNNFCFSPLVKILFCFSFWKLDLFIVQIPKTVLVYSWKCSVKQKKLPNKSSRKLLAYTKFTNFYVKMIYVSSKQ